MILDERIKRSSGKLRILNQLAVLPTCEPLIGANPQTPIARYEQLSNMAMGETLTRGGLPWGGPNPVEAKQAEFRAQPEITVGRLSHRVDGGREKAFADRPRFMSVLIDVERWIQSASRGAASQQYDKFDNGPPLHAPNYLALWVGRTPSSAADPLVGLFFFATKIFGAKIVVLSELSRHCPLSATTSARL
jgi:hypothetical protein